MNRTFFEYHPVIGYKFIVDLKTRVQHEAGGYLIKTNNYGFRSDFDFAPKKPEGFKRILVFGDSYTAGDGVSNKFRYTDILERELSNVEVYNFGLPGSGTDQQYLLYKEYGHQFEHDLLVISVLVENIRRVNSGYRYYLDSSGNQKVWMKPYFEIQGTELVLKNNPVNPLPIEIDALPESERQKIDTGGRFEPLRKLIKKVGLKEIAQKLTKFQPVPEYNSAKSSEWLLLKAILETWIKESPVPVLLMPIPLFHHVEETAESGPYQARFKELGSLCQIHDPLPDLLKYSLEERRAFRFQTDVHPNASGHQALADSLFPTIKKMI